MKKNTIQAVITNFVDQLVIPDNDSFYIHPSVNKGHQKLDKVEEKFNSLLKEIKIPPKVISEATQYYLNNGELDSYLKLKVGSEFIVGPVHSGKTLYLVSKYIIALSIASSYSINQKVIKYKEYAEIIQAFKAAINIQEILEYELFAEYKNASVLLIDDLFSSGRVTEYEMNIIYTIIDYRHANWLPTLITTNLTVENIAALDNGERLLRRLTEHADSLVFTSKE